MNSNIMNTRVYVYWNLHRACWSVRALSGPNRGRVVAHADSILLELVSPRVSESGRQRVIREQRKNVHAGITGYVARITRVGAPLLWSTSLASIGDPITYNPYRSGTFTYRASGEPFTGASSAVMVRTDGRPAVLVST